MNIKPYDKTIRDLLGSKRQFLIPRFQREYSWDKKNYQEFFEDMMGNLAISNGKFLQVNIFLEPCSLSVTSQKAQIKKFKLLTDNNV